MAIEFKKYGTKAYQKELKEYKKGGSKAGKLPPHLAQLIDDIAKKRINKQLKKKGFWR